MTNAQPTPHPSHLFIVPTSSGRLISLADLQRSPSDIDDILDEMFGEVDTDGPGLTDAALVGGGACAVAAALIAGLPAAVLGAGIASIGLGSILPLRSAIRRGKHAVQERKVRSVVGDGQLLDTSHTSTKQLVAVHNSLFDCVDAASATGVRLRSVAHGLVDEAAALLGARPARSEGEIRYVTDRVAALEGLLLALEAPRADEVEVTRAQLAARLEVESLAGRSALTDAAELYSDLTGER